MSGGTVRLTEAVRRAIVAHAEAGYHQEVCGYLVGSHAADGGEWSVREARAAANQAPADRERRYRISAADVRRVESDLEPTGGSLIGFYHSHPDHRAVPSEFDRSHAWPWYAYLIVSVHPEGAREMAAFELDAESSEFLPVPAAIVAGGPSMLAEHTSGPPSPPRGEGVDA